MTNQFTHYHSAHCESGVVSSLLMNYGLSLNEAMVFGLASGLTFAYVPVVKLAGMPLVAYRMPPGYIIRNSFKRLHVPFQIKKFADPERGMQALDDALAEGKLVGLQTSVYWLPYFPEEMRFHFNAHNILVYGKEHDLYLISDPVFEVTMKISRDDLIKARFAKGALAGKGAMLTIDEKNVPQTIAYASLISEAIRKTTRMMRAPVPIAGIRGIRYLANNLNKMSHTRKSDRYKKLYLGHIVRMQEEIGTGGAGFRYMYAFFLEQAAKLCDFSEFKDLSAELTGIGDAWRVFARDCVKQCRQLDQGFYKELSENLNLIADKEQKFWYALGCANAQMRLQHKV